MDLNQTTNQMPSGSAAPKSNSMLWAWIALAVVFAGFSLAFYYFVGYEPAAKEQGQAVPTEEDVILNDLEGVKLDDLDSELANIDKELAP